jgi:hypothetical protein
MACLRKGFEEPRQKAKVKRAKGQYAGRTAIFHFFQWGVSMPEYPAYSFSKGGQYTGMLILKTH